MKVLKKTKNIIFVIVFAVIIITVFSACQDNPITFTIQTPTNLRVEDGVIKWDAVEKADDYVININNNNFIVQGTTYSNIEVGVLYDISVRARNVWAVSDWSDSISGKILDTPTNCVYFNSRFYYDEVEGAISYVVNVDGEEYLLENGGVSLFEFLEPGNKTAKIKAIGDRENYFDSFYSDEIIVRVAEILWEDIEVKEPLGDGTINKPYRINTLENVKWLSVSNGEDNLQFDNKYFIMEYDVDFRLISGYVPIGSNESPFLGSFDGKEHGFYYLNIVANNAGIFGNIGEGAEVKNLKNYYGKVTGTASAGGIASSNLGLIMNCESTATIKANVAGGIVAENIGNRVVLMCTNRGYVNGENVGGIAGWNWNGSINQCINYGEISGANNGAGIVGTNAGNVFYCENYGDISALNAGGLTANNIGYIKISSNQGNIKSKKLGGGLCSLNNGTVKYCYNVGSVTCVNRDSKSAYIGGIAGRMDDGIIISSYNMGIITNDYVNDLTGEVVGYYRSGLIDKCYYLEGSKVIANTDKYIGDCIACKKNVFSSSVLVGLLNKNVDKKDMIDEDVETFTLGEEYPIFYWQKSKLQRMG